MTGVALALTVASLAAACAKSDSATGGAPTSSAPTNVNLGEKPAGKPVPGGQLTMSIEAETNDFNPASGQWSPSSYAVANAIYDPLVAVDDKGIAHPYLAEAIDANGDYTEWTFRLRPGVTFHDGTPVNAAAVKRNLDNVKGSTLTGQAFSAIDSITTPDDTTVFIKMNRPWATFPATLSSQSGYIIAPSQLDDPAGANASLVGSGPFTFSGHLRDSSFKTTKNPKYWQKDKDGVSLPYLDALDFSIITDATSRLNSLAAGDINAMTVGTAQALLTTADQASRGEVQRISNDKTETDETILAFNTSKEPFNDPIARQAIAFGTDQNQMAETAYHGANPGAWGMFAEGSPYYITPEEAGYPKRDVEKAKSLAKEYEQKHGKPLEFTALVSASADALAVLQAYQADMATYGVKMVISSVETTQLISKVIVAGDYQAAMFALWSSPTPDQGYVFIATPANNNGISLNFPRYDDPELVKALDAFRATGDRQERIDNMKKVQQELAKNLQVLFLVHGRSAFVYANNVHGFTAAVFPGTDAHAYNPYPQTPFFTYAWKSAG